jgi:hypothetical protein
MHLAKRHAVEDAREAFDALSDDELKLLLELSQKIAKQN